MTLTRSTKNGCVRRPTCGFCVWNGQGLRPGLNVFSRTAYAVAQVNERFFELFGFLLGETASAAIAIDAVRLMLKLIHFKNDKALFYFPYTLNEYMCNL